METISVQPIGKDKSIKLFSRNDLQTILNNQLRLFITWFWLKQQVLPKRTNKCK